MTPDQIAQLVLAPEDSRLERKPDGVNRAEIRRTLVAFANSLENGQEAVLFIGVRDDGAIQGVANADNAQMLVRAIAAQDCYPRIQVQTTVVAVADKTVVAAVVAHSQARPHFAGPAYVRVGAESVAATEAQYEALVASRHEKCGVIQRWRVPITVREEGYRLETMRTTPGWIASRLCSIVECNAHNVTVRDLGSGNHFTIPLTRIEISYDHQHHRDQLTVIC
jgi:hypothetical protein